MIEIENFNTNGRSDKHQILAYAQTISNFFLEAIEQNDCNVKVVVGFYQELEDTINSIRDLDEAFSTPLKLKEWAPPRDLNDLEKDRAEDPDILRDPQVVDVAVKALKEKCFNCKLKLPKIKFEHDFQFLHNKLKLQLEIFEAVFKKPAKTNYCHFAFGMQNQCIPDLIRLISFLLMAYAAIMALKKLPSISLGAFIKGIVGTLLAKIIASINLSLDMSDTGLPCLLAMLEELAYKVPTKETLYTRLPADQVKYLPDQEYVPVSIYERNVRQQVEKGVFTPEYGQIKIDRYKKKNDPIRFYTKELEKQVGSAEESISSVFREINEIVNQAQEDINSYIDSILGVINFFECEQKRSGPDFSEVIEYMDKITTVINVISSIIAIQLKYTLHIDLCKDEKSIKDLETVLKEGKPKKPLSNQDLTEIVEEFTGKKAQLSEDGLSILIYDKPKQRLAPKLDLTGCNFKEFAEAHRLPNLIKKVIDDTVEEDRRKTVKESDTSDSNRRVNDFIDRFKDIIDLPGDKKNNPTGDPDDRFYVPIIKVGGRDPARLKPNPYNPFKKSRVTPNIDKHAKKVTDTFIRNNFPVSKGVSVNVDLNNINIDLPKFTPIGTFIEDTNRNDKDIYEVIGSVSLDPKTIDDAYKDFSDKLDELTDFIYNDPFENEESEEGSKDPVFNDYSEDLNKKKKSIFNKHLQDTQGQYQPASTECRSVEDVLSVLNNIKI